MLSDAHFLTFKDVEVRFMQCWLDCEYDRAVEIAHGLPTDELLKCALFTAKYFGLKDLEFFTKLF